MGGINYDATVQTQDCNITTIIVAPNSAEKEFEIPFSDGGGHTRNEIAPHRREKGDRDEDLGSLSRHGGRRVGGLHFILSLSSEAFLSGKYRSLEKHG